MDARYSYPTNLEIINKALDQLYETDFFHTDLHDEFDQITFQLAKFKDKLMAEVKEQELAKLEDWKRSVL